MSKTPAGWTPSVWDNGIITPKTLTTPVPAAEIAWIIAGDLFIQPTGIAKAAVSDRHEGLSHSAFEWLKIVSSVNRPFRCGRWHGQSTP